MRFCACVFLGDWHFLRAKFVFLDRSFSNNMYSGTRCVICILCVCLCSFVNRIFVNLKFLDLFCWTSLGIVTRELIYDCFED